MTAATEAYTQALRKACSKMDLKYFPQVETSDLLYRIITLEDIYLPLFLKEVSLSDGIDYSDPDPERLLRLIDEKIAKLEESIRTHSLTAQPSHAAQTGCRALIESSPGGGKTTFCKRFVLALLNQDHAFFEKYGRESRLFFCESALPVLVNCRNAADFSAEELRTLNYRQILYRMCAADLGGAFSEVSEEAFARMLDDRADELCVILDGWDEIFHAEKEAALCEMANQFLREHPQADMIITVRASYEAPTLQKPYTGRYQIGTLSDDEVREFCQKWCDVILNPGPKQAEQYASIADQILQSRNPQVMMMMRNPLDLSLLLTVSKNDGRLPENKAKLFEKLVDLYIYWGTVKNAGLRTESLTEESLRSLLAYIAAAFTKSDRLYCDEETLRKLIEQAKKDLVWSDLSRFTMEQIVRELSYTGILTRTYNGRFFSFSESQGSRTGHRQMQEYLTAYAIIYQFADEEYNSMTPGAILEDKYDVDRWREVVLFLMLMNTGRTRQTILRRLTEKARENPGSTKLNDLLFEIIVSSSTGISEANAHTVYDITLQEQITDRQIECILLLTENETGKSQDFIRYIDERFSESVRAGECRFGCAKAVVEAARALQRGVSPLAHAQNLMRSEDDIRILTGARILMVLAQCRYEKSRNKLSDSVSIRQLPPEWLALFRTLLQTKPYAVELLKALQSAAIANFFPFEALFGAEDLADAAAKLHRGKDAEAGELVLSIAPIWKKAFRPVSGADKAVQEQYTQRLREEIRRKDTRNAAFTFSICSAIGCWPDSEQKKLEWEQLSRLYHGCGLSGNPGVARYRQMRNELVMQRGWWEIIDKPPAVWTRTTEQPRDGLLYVKPPQEMQISIPKSGLTKTANRLLPSTVTDSDRFRADLACLMRRGEITSVTFRQGQNEKNVTVPDALLKFSLLSREPFSIVNYALIKAGIAVNQTGDYEAGKRFFSSQVSEQRRPLGIWTAVRDWWLELAIRESEYEGLAVLAWMMCRNLPILEHLSGSTLDALYAQTLRPEASHHEDFNRLGIAILASQV